MIVHFTTRNTERVGNVLAVGASKNVDWPAWIDRIGNFVYQNGGSRVVFEGRPGLQKAIPCSVIRHIVYEVDLNDAGWQRQTGNANE